MNSKSGPSSPHTLSILPEASESADILSRVRYTRRDLLALTGALATAYLLEGCGSGGGGGASLALKTVNGTVTLPSGSTLTLTGLQVANGVNRGSVQSSRAFSIGVLPGNPSLVVLQNAAGRGVLMGFADPDASSSTLDAESTAIVLLYFGLGGYMMPLDSKRKLLQMIKADAATATLTQVVAARIAANPYALEDNDAQIGTALQAAITDITSNGRSARMSRAVSAPASSSQAIVPAHSRAGTPQLLVQPSTRQSGVDVLQASDQTALIATNNWRRHCTVVVYEVGKDDAQGVRQDYPKAQQVGSSIDLTATKALGLFSTFTGILSGQTAYVPVSTPPIVLTMAANTSKTYFEAIVLGSAFSLTEPAYFSDPKYTDQVDLWRTFRQRLNLLSWSFDIVFGLIMEVWGLRDLVRDEAAALKAIDNLSKLGESSVTDLLQKAGRGDMVKTAEGLLTLVANSDIVSQKVLTALEPILGVAKAQLEKQGAALAVGTRLLTVLNVVGLVLGAADIGAVLHDLGAANAADLWTAVLFQSNTSVTLTPQSVGVLAGDLTDLTAAQVGYNGPDPLTYHYKLLGGNGTLSSGGNTGTDIDSGSGTVTYTASLGAQVGNRDQVLVDIYAGPSTNPKKNLLGSAASSIDIVDIQFGQVLVKFNSLTGTNQHSAKTRIMNPVLAQHIPWLPNVYVPVIIESIHANAQNEGFHTYLNFGNNGVQQGQVLDLSVGQFYVELDLRNSSTGTNTRYFATSGKFTVLAVGSNWYQFKVDAIFSPGPGVVADVSVKGYVLAR